MSRTASPPTSRPAVRWQAPFIAALAAGLLAFSAPERATAHAGEVHTEPAPVAPSKPAGPEPSPGGSGGEGSGSEPSVGAASRAADASRTAEGPPPPVEPETDPTLHFVALGALLVGGAGFLLVRRRRRLLA